MREAVAGGGGVALCLAAQFQVQVKGGGGASSAGRVASSGWCSGGGGRSSRVSLPSFAGRSGGLLLPAGAASSTRGTACRALRWWQRLHTRGQRLLALGCLRRGGPQVPIVQLPREAREPCPAPAASSSSSSSSARRTSTAIASASRHARSSCRSSRPHSSTARCRHTALPRPCATPGVRASLAARSPGNQRSTANTGVHSCAPHASCISGCALPTLPARGKHAPAAAAQTCPLPQTCAWRERGPRRAGPVGWMPSPPQPPAGSAPGAARATAAAAK